MTKSIPTERRATPWYFRPSLVLPIVAAMIIFGALITPETAGIDPRLTTYSSSGQGARLFFELAQRFGWQTEQRLVPEPPEGARIIHAVLSPEIPLSRSDVHTLLERVRNGGALLVVLDERSGLSDSLRTLTSRSGNAPRADTMAAPCPRDTRRLMALYWPNGIAHLTSLRWRGAPPDSLTTFLEVSKPPEDTVKDWTRPAFVGFPLGRGRVAVASDPDLLRNDALRMCKDGLDVAVMRGLEYLRDGGETRRTRIVFDEYHHGFGEQPGTMSTVVSYLGATSSGRAFAQLLIAGLVLLFAAAPRLIQPREVERIERRSPLEHIDALARAYIQVGATRTAVARLVRGVRRRRERGAIHAVRALTDDAYLAHVEEAAPGIAGDIAQIRRALATPVSRRDMETVGVALQRMENFLTRT